MKRIIIGLAITVSTVTSYSQRSVEALFDKYSDREDFTCITLSGNLVKLAKALCDEDDDHNCLPQNITTIRILAQNDEGRPAGNFYDMVEKELDRRKYEEFMRIRKYNQDLVMLVRTAGRNIKEFLVVAGGKDNVLIQIKGNMTFKEAERFSMEIKKDNGKELVDEMN